MDDALKLITELIGSTIGWVPNFGSGNAGIAKNIVCILANRYEGSVRVMGPKHVQRREAKAEFFSRRRAISVWFARVMRVELN